jgi:hypothetical protein
LPDDGLDRRIRGWSLRRCRTGGGGLKARIWRTSAAEQRELSRGSFRPVGKLTALLSKLRPQSRGRDEWEKTNDSAWDARTGSMVDGKGLSPTGAVIDVESDSQRPK